MHGYNIQDRELKLCMCIDTDQEKVMATTITPGFAGEGEKGNLGITFESTSMD